MNLSEIRDTLVADLKITLGNHVVDVLAHRGQFSSVADIHKLATRTPTVLVAIRGFNDTRQRVGNDDLVEADVVVFVLTTDRGKARRDALGLALAEMIRYQLLALCNTWSFVYAEPDRLVARDLTSLAIDKAGIGLWAINGLFPVQVDRTASVTLDTFLGFDADHLSDAEPPQQEVAMQTTDTYPETTS